MTRKDYELIANVVRLNHRAWAGSVGAHAVRSVAVDLATQLRLDNPRFCQELFLEACGLEIH